MTADWSFYDRGFSIFPLLAQTKNPAVKWESYQTKRATAPQVDVWRRQAWNTGVATGAVSNCFILDCDNLMARIAAETRGLPPTLTVTTPRGTHFYFRHPGWNVSNHAGRSWTRSETDPEGVEGWDLRGDGGYVVGPGSYYVPTPAERSKGKVEGAYTIERDLPMADAPGWLLALAMPKAHKPAVPAKTTDVTSAYGARALREEVARIVDGANGELNHAINMAAFKTAQLVAGGEIEASEAFEALLRAIADRGVADDGKSPGTIQRGWDAGLLEARSSDGRQANGPIDPLVALGSRAVATGTVLPPPSRGAPRALSLSGGEAEDKTNHLAVEQWFGACRFTAAYDEFADRLLLNDQPITDHNERDAWLKVRERSCVRFPKELFADVIRNIAWTNRFHPLREWLDETQATWDGVSRIDGWMTTYLGVEDSEYSRAIGALFLTAAVRRARRPGSKFDEIIVLEGPQGIDKSSAIAALCPSQDWFSEDFNVSMNSRELLEATEGKWIVEAPELSKLNASEVEHVKHMLSRRFDRARKAYDRSPTERGRQWVPVATTNGSQYLTDPTGNRRFWPVKVSRVSMGAIVADRVQLWAEAAVREASGASIRLPEHLWDAAAVEQAERVVVDPFVEILASTLEQYPDARIKSVDVWFLIGVQPDRRSALGKKLSDTMRRLGWRHSRLRFGGTLEYCYVIGDGKFEVFYDQPTRRLTLEKPQLQVIT